LRTSSHYYEGGEESAFGERRQGLLPMLIARDPHRVLVMGLGAGVTLGAVADYPGAEVHGVELMAEVLAALPLFSRANGDVASRANVILHQADARTLVSRLRTNGAAFDVVIGDLFHPERESSALMYTHEHFAAVRRLLAPGGLFVQWLPLHELPPAALATVIATFLDSFPAAAGWLAYFNVQTPAFGLVGSEAPIQVSVGDLEARIAAPALREALATTLLDKPMEVLGGYVTDRSGLLRLAGSAPPATDDRPLVDVLVARELPIAPPFASLQAVLAARTSADSLLRGAARPGDVNRVDAFREAVADSLLGQAHTARGEWRAAAVLFRAGALRAPEFALNRILLERVAASLRRVGDARGADDVLRGLAAPSPRPDP
jgi:spermidine synthase